METKLSAEQQARRDEAVSIRKELALAFRGRAVAQGWSPKSKTFNTRAIEFLAGSRATLDALDKSYVLPDMMLVLTMVRPVDEMFAMWIKTANETKEPA